MNTVSLKIIIPSPFECEYKCSIKDTKLRNWKRTRVS